MTKRRSNRRLTVALFATTLAAASASALAAQGRELFTFDGRVDREVLISMRGRTAWTDAGSGGYEERGRVGIDGSLPREQGDVVVRLQDGRGEVDVIQQPSARNDYTLVVRITDRRGGSDRYRLHAYWRPASDRAGSAYGRIGDIRGNDRDRWDDRARDRRDHDRNDRNSLYWSGRVDDVLEIRLQGNRLNYRTLSGNVLRDVRTDISRYGLPRRDVLLRVDELAGRGSIRVVQQPSARNGYTAILHIRDPHRGYGYYAFDLWWEERGHRR
jgi:hypothetical protein